ncbi:unnamed protein product [Owenia fusiformis]|uniref:Uncharacterized protein n=1 Tax=Owenia fusiformis TaxID=6347 RepID=A0A8S4NQZ5_OWEFU|nr:unnamed protein product [Owenia fusiformis]
MDTYRLLGMGVILLMVLSLSQATCPEDVPGESQECMAEYSESLRVREERMQNFFTGTDPETIRYICSKLADGSQCVRRLRQDCPKHKHADISGALTNIPSILPICSYTQFYEIYARHQSCYRRIEGSNTCWDVYLHNREPLMPQVFNGQERAIAQICGYAYTLLECVKKQVDRHCGEEAASLMDILVKSSTKVGDLCQFINPNAVTTTQRPIKTEVEYKTKTEKPPKQQATKDGTNTENTSSTKTFSSSLFSLSLVLTIFGLLFR